MADLGGNATPGELMKPSSLEAENRENSDADSAEFTQQQKDLIEHVKLSTNDIQTMEANVNDMDESVMGLRRRRLERYFMEMRQVDEELFKETTDELISSIQSFEGSIPDDLSTATIPTSWSDVETAISTVQSDCESPNQLNETSQARKWFTKMRNGLDNHGVLLDLRLPTGSEHVSLIAGAVTMIIKASSNHTQVSEFFANWLIGINEAVALMQTNLQVVYDAPWLQQLYMRFYASVFTCLTKVMTWFHSRSMGILLRSFDENLAQTFADNIQLVKRTSELIGEHIDLYKSMDIRESKWTGQRAHTVMKHFLALLENEMEQRRLQGVIHGRVLKNMLTGRLQRSNDKLNRLAAEILVDFNETSRQTISGQVMEDIPEDTGSVPSTERSTRISHRQAIDRRSILESPKNIPPSDSGYASMPAGNDILKAAASASRIDVTKFLRRSTVHPQHVHQHIWTMVEELAKMVPQSTAGDPGIVDRLATTLPNLLKGFALMIGHCADTPLHRNIMYFVYRFRKEIATEFRGYALEKAAQVASTSALTLNERMVLWLSPRYKPPLKVGVQQLTEEHVSRDEYEDEYEDEYMEESEDDDGDPDEVVQSAEETSQHRDCLIKSSAYFWLRNALQQEILLAPAIPDIRDRIRHEVLCSLPSIRISRHRDAQSYHAIFDLDWDPQGFIQQQYSEASSDCIGMAITLTASSQDSQALTVREYLSQVWPSIGEHVIRLIQGVVGGEWKEERYAILPDKSSVTARYIQSTFTVIAHGSATTIAELGELLSWLGAALRPSPREDGIIYCTPRIRNLKNQYSKRPASSTSEVNFEIGFTFSEDDATFPNGKCWHSMFRNPVVVRGFPIARKSTTETGLETSLDMMACMVRAKRIVPFGGTYFLKGFSSMLALVAQKGGTFIWHHLHNPGGQHISYFDHKTVLSNIPTYQQLESGRHLIGWCPEISFMAGAVDDNVNYDIEKSNLPETHSTCVLDRVSINGGKFVPVGASIRVGVAQTPIHVGRDTYFDKMTWIAKRYAILWDEGKDRGWLVNGPSVLLHLVLASIQENLGGKLGKEILFKKESLMLPPDRHTTDSAFHVLTNPNNKLLAIHIDKVEKWTEETVGEGDDSSKPITKAKTTYIRFENRVEKVYGLLEQVMEHQTRIEGIDLKRRVRKYLEGWDFRDFAAGEDYILPRVKTLQTLGKGWVDLTRELDAITLFGKGFGEVIRPADTITMCGTWARQPSRKYYLAACISDLKDAPGIHFKTHEVKVGKRLVWKVPDDLFKPCTCTSDRPRKADHSHYVQVLTPQDGKPCSLPRSTGKIKLSRQGAVVFGYNSRFFLRWKDEGNPEEEEVQENDLPELSQQESVFYDSAIGSNLASVTPSGKDEEMASVQFVRSPSSRTNSETGSYVSAVEEPQESSSSKEIQAIAFDDTIDEVGSRHGEQSPKVGEVRMSTIEDTPGIVAEAMLGKGKVQGNEVRRRFEVVSEPPFDTTMEGIVE